MWANMRINWKHRVLLITYPIHAVARWLSDKLQAVLNGTTHTETNRKRPQLLAIILSPGKRTIYCRFLSIYRYFPLYLWWAVIYYELIGLI